MIGTASTVANWVLLELPGPWGYKAVLESRLPVAVAKALWRRARDLGLRIILLRRPGRRETGQGLCYLVHTGPDRPWMESLNLAAPQDLLDVDLASMAAGRPPRAGQEEPGPLLLACTNGRRDPCCAELGRPVAASLVSSFGDAVWECSHIGGDRFAGNLVCFPHGVYYGRVGPEEAPAVARAYAEGRLSLDHYRGRSCYPFDVQAAEYFVRRRQDLTEIDGVALVQRVDEGEGRVRVTFLAGGRSVAVIVLSRPADQSRPLTCHSELPSRPNVYELLEE
ncbi:MAG: sucrase ferredoxin [Actinomycetota bacterium]